MLGKLKEGTLFSSKTRYMWIYPKKWMYVVLSYANVMYKNIVFSPLSWNFTALIILTYFILFFG